MNAKKIVSLFFIVFFIYCGTNYAYYENYGSGARRIRATDNPGYEYEKEKLLSELGLHGGNLTQAAESLGISTEELRILIDKYDLEDNLEKITQIVDALKATKGIISQAADLLGVHPMSLTLDIYKLYLNPTSIQLKKRADEILKSIGEAEGDLIKASELLGIDKEKLLSEIEEFNLGSEVREIEEIIQSLKWARGDVSQAAEDIIGVTRDSLYTKIYQYHLRPFINKIKKEIEQIKFALGKSSGNLMRADLIKAAEILGISHSDINALIYAYDMFVDLGMIDKTIKALMKTKGNRAEADELLGARRGETQSRIRDYYLYQVISDIKIKVEEILSALGKSGGNIQKAASELGVERITLVSFIGTYNLSKELDEIQECYQALQNADWDFKKAAQVLGIDEEVLRRKVNRYYLRLSQEDEKEKIIFALANAQGEISSAARSLEISEIELQGLIERYDLYETQSLIRDMVRAYKNTKGNMDKAGELLGKSGSQWFSLMSARYYLYPVLYKIDKKIENLIEVLAKGEGELGKSAKLLGISKIEMDALVTMYGLDEDLAKIRELVNGLKKASGNLSALANEMNISIETVRNRLLRYYLLPFRYELNKKIEEVLIVMGGSGGDLERASEILEISKGELEALITIYGLDDRLVDLEKKVDSLEKARGKVGRTSNPSLSWDNIRRSYLDLYVYQIRKEVEKILYAVGISGGDLEKASEQLSYSLPALESLITRYNLNEDLETIQNIVRALEETGGDVSAAARLLRMDSSNLWTKIYRYYLKLRLEEIKN